MTGLDECEALLALVAKMIPLPSLTDSPSGGAHLNDFPFSQSFDVTHWRLTEEAAVFTIESADTFVSDLQELIHLNELRTYLPAGLIVIPSNFSNLTAQAESYRRAGTGVVCVDRLPKNWSGDGVTANNEAGAYNATRHLLQLGHTRLATITGPLHLPMRRSVLAASNTQ